MRMTVTAVGALKTAGNFLKQYFTANGTTGFVWAKAGQNVNIAAGDIADGDWTLKASTNPKYPDEYTFTGKFERGTGQPTQETGTNPNPTSVPLSVKDLQITRQNACNVSANLMSGKGTEDIGKFWATVRQVQHYTSTGLIVIMSTKEQHAAIMAMFGKDIDKAREAVGKACGYPYLDAMTFDEAAAFLDIGIQDLPS
jgi:hypothetical protein